jgi:hypothetical protein
MLNLTKENKEQKNIIKKHTEFCHEIDPYQKNPNN